MATKLKPIKEEKSLNQKPAQVDKSSQKQSNLKPVQISNEKIVNRNQMQPINIEEQKIGSKLVREKFKNFLIRDQCGRCKQLGIFVCSHDTPVRDNFRNRINEDGSLYISPRHSQSIDKSKQIDTPKNNANVSKSTNFESKIVNNQGNNANKIASTKNSETKKA